MHPGATGARDCSCPAHGAPVTTCRCCPPKQAELHASELYAHCRALANPEFAAAALPSCHLLTAWLLCDLGRLEQAGP